jgi:ketosteroid isomerase-like protein
MRPTGLPAISNVIVAIVQTVPAVPAARPVGDRADDVDTVISAGWYEGLYKATGTVARARFAHVWRMRDGKVDRFEQIVDSATFNAALN